MSLPFVPDGDGCGDWRINQGVHQEKFQQPTCPMTIPPQVSTYVFYNSSQQPVKLYYLQEGQWRPCNKPMIEPGQQQINGYVYLTTEGLYQVRNSCAEPLDEFRVTQNNETIVWPPAVQHQSVAISTVKKEADLAWGAIILGAILIFLFLLVRL